MLHRMPSQIFQCEKKCLGGDNWDNLINSLLEISDQDNHVKRKWNKPQISMLNNLMLKNDIEEKKHQRKKIKSIRVNLANLLHVK